MFHRPSRDALWAIILLAILLRAAVMVRGPGRFDDPDNYVPLARSLSTGAGFTFNGRPTGYRPPLYPLLLAPLISHDGQLSTLGIMLMHLGLGAGAVWLTAAAAKGSGFSQGQVAIAALVTACDPVLVWQSRSVMTETPAAFLIAASLAALCRPGWSGPVLGGFGFGLAGLCRPSLLAGAVLTITAAFVAKPGEPKARLVRGGVLAITLVVVLLPWMIRNTLVLGEPVWTTTHGGYTLALANNPVYYDQVLNGPRGRVWTGEDQWLWWDSVNRATKGMSEPRGRSLLENPGLETGSRSAGRLRPCHADPDRTLLERGPGVLRLFQHGTVGRHRVDDAPLGRGLYWVRTAGPLALAADRGSLGRNRPDARPRLVLDRPGHACPDCAGDRAHGRRRPPAVLSAARGTTL